ncbi:MAG: hypothetical protein ACU833_12860 [Gammaproteobacteria bacterium]
MAEQEKDNFWVWVGGLIVITVILVFMLKARETEHLQGGYEQLDNEVKQQMNQENR